MLVQLSTTPPNSLLPKLSMYIEANTEVDAGKCVQSFVTVGQHILVTTGSCRIGAGLYMVIRSGKSWLFLQVVK